MAIKKDDFFELIEDMREPSQVREPQALLTPPLEEPPPELPKTELSTEEDSDNEDDDIPEVAEPAKVKKPLELISEDDLDDTTEIAVILADLAQSNGFEAWVNLKKGKKLRRHYGSDAEVLAEELLARQEAATISGVKESFTDAEKGILRIENSANEMIDSLPWDDDEKEVLQKPLRKYLKKKGGKIPDEWMLMIAVARLVGGRAANVMQL